VIDVVLARGLERRVAQKLGNHQRRHAHAVQGGRVGLSEHMGRQLLDAGLGGDVFGPFPKSSGGEMLSDVEARKQVIVRMLALKIRPPPGQVRAKHRIPLFEKWNRPSLLAFAKKREYRPAFLHAHHREGNLDDLVRSQSTKWHENQGGSDWFPEGVYEVEVVL